MSPVITPSPSHVRSVRTERRLSWFGTILAGLPILAGIGAGLAAVYTPLLGGIENMLVIVWSVPLYASPLGLLGAALLVAALRGTPRSRRHVIIATGPLLAAVALTIVLVVVLAGETGPVPTPPALSGPPLALFQVAAAALAVTYAGATVALVALGARHLHGESPRARRT